MGCQTRCQASTCCRQLISLLYALLLFNDGVSEETEKYAHVTFFNGGVEKQFSGEERHMVPSPKVATYDLDPKMNAHGVADKVVDLNTFVEDVTQQGLAWHIIAWGDTRRSHVHRCQLNF